MGRLVSVLNKVIKIDNIEKGLDSIERVKQ